LSASLDNKYSAIVKLSIGVSITDLSGSKMEHNIGCPFYTIIIKSTKEKEKKKGEGGTERREARKRKKREERKEKRKKEKEIKKGNNIVHTIMNCISQVEGATTRSPYLKF
jgi:hypothetical protein